MGNPVLVWRQRHGFSRFRLARLTGLSTSTLQALDAGARGVLPDRLRAVVVAVDGEDAWSQLSTAYADWRGAGIHELGQEAMV